MIFTLEQVLKLTGTLDDTPGGESPRERFRMFLREHVGSAGDLRDFVQECRIKPGLQYNRALQDLVNHVGTLLGFEVEFGRYAGVPGQIGHDGLWRSPEGLHVVIEAKTSETYPIKVTTLLGYIDELVAAGKVPSSKEALGLFVVAKPDPEVQQVANSIVAGGYGDRLRLIAVESLLTLAELLETHDVAHKDILSVLRPSTPSIDSLVSLLLRIAGTATTSEQPAAGTGGVARVSSSGSAPPGGTTVTSANGQAVAPAALVAGPTSAGPNVPTPGGAPPDPATGGKVTAGQSFHLVPAGDEEDRSASACVEALVGGHGVWAFSAKAQGRKAIVTGDRVAFYAAGVGVVADARVAQAPVQELHPAIRDPEGFPWLMRLEAVRIYTTAPIALDAERRATLEAFQQASDAAKKVWAWFVQSTHRVSPHDFVAITASTSPNTAAATL